KEKASSLHVVSSIKQYSDAFLKDKSFSPIKEGAKTGVSGLLLTKGVLKNFPVILILAEASEDYLDPGAAALVISSVSKYLNIKIDTKKLDKEAKDVADQVRKAVVKSKLPYKRSSDMGSMYG
ncbi:MAG: PAC2 family protein, partial [Candidatus ainarchaeum sp.]|nr:PAC2 family protein [Candidatus ainarchaeum sp.]